jgi:hypothetical protein
MHLDIYLIISNAAGLVAEPLVVLVPLINDVAAMETRSPNARLHSLCSHRHDRGSYRGVHESSQESLVCYSRY